MFASAVCFSGGFLVSALGVWLHQVWLLYLGYGVLGGIGLGLGYISPVSTLIKWFPDRPGMATGMAIMGFGGGAMIGAPLAQALMNHFRTPTSIGRRGDVCRDGGDLFLLHDVRRADGAPAAAGLAAGGLRRERAGARSLRASVTADDAIKTPQFWLLWAVLFLNVTAGIGVLGQASPMIQEMFAGRVTAAAAAGFVGLLSLFNMVGRFCWSSLSDYIGRKNTYAIYFLLGAVLVRPDAANGTARLGRPVRARLRHHHEHVRRRLRDDPRLPARPVRHRRKSGAIHGRLLTAWSAAGVAGPVLVNYIREYQIEHGVPKAEAYTVTMYIMAGLLIVGFVCNLLVRPSCSKHAYHINDREIGEPA